MHETHNGICMLLGDLAWLHWTVLGTSNNSCIFCCFDFIIMLFHQWRV